MHPLRKLLVLGTNELLSRGLISLEAGQDSREDPDRHVWVDLVGRRSIIRWGYIGFDEMKIGVRWDYDHGQHPQAELRGNTRETFRAASPLAIRASYANFVGAVTNGWLERRDGKYLQGRGRYGLFEMYLRKSTEGALRSLADPQPSGFAAEGKFHL